MQNSLERFDYLTLMKNILIALLLLLTLSACQKEQSSHGNNPADISGFLDLTTYRPTAVEYDLTQHGNGLLGTKDYYLQAILYYDDATFDAFKKACSTLPKSSPPVTADYDPFDFSWMSKNIKAERSKATTNNMYPGTVLTTSNPNCSILLLNNKALVHYITM